MEVERKLNAQDRLDNQIKCVYSNNCWLTPDTISILSHKVARSWNPARNLTTARTRPPLPLDREVLGGMGERDGWADTGSVDTQYTCMRRTRHPSLPPFKMALAVQGSMKGCKLQFWHYFQLSLHERLHYTRCTVTQQIQGNQRQTG